MLRGRGKTSSISQLTFPETRETSSLSARCCLRRKRRERRERRETRQQSRDEIVAFGISTTSTSDSGGDGSSAHVWTDDVKAILLFALPALGSSLASPLLSAIDTAVIGQCATTIELAALGPSSTVFDSLGLIFAFLQVASINKLAGLAGSGSQGEGEERRGEKRKAVTEFGVLSLFMGVALMLGLLLGAGWIMAATTSQASMEALGPAVLYTRIRAISVPAFIMQITMQGILMGLSKDSVNPLIAVLISGLINTLGDVLLVGCLGTGIAGAAIATVFAQLVAASYLFVKVYQQVYESKEEEEEEEEEKEAMRLSLPPLGSLGPLLRESVPFLMMKVLTCVKVFFMNYMSTMFGSSTLAAHLVALTVWRVLILVGEPLSYAAQSFAPQYFKDFQQEEGGAGLADQGFYYIKLILGIGVGLSAVMFVVTRVGYVRLSTLFTQDPLIRESARSVFNQVTLSVCIFPLLLSLEGSLLAIGRVKSLVYAMASNVLFMLCGWYLIHTLDYSLRGVWCMFSGMHSFYALVMLAMIVAVRTSAKKKKL